MKNAYLSRLKRHSKRLYIAILVYIIGSLVLIQTRYNPYMFIEATPVFTWGMFSTRLAPDQHQQYTVYTLKQDGQTVNLPTSMDHFKIFFSYTIPQYDLIAEHEYADPGNAHYVRVLQQLGLPVAWAECIGNKPESVRQYPKWLKRYLSQGHRTPIQELEVWRYRVHFNDAGQLITDDRKRIIHD